MELILSREAAKSLTTLPKRDAAALMEKTQRFAAEPFAQHTFAMPMSDGANRVRIRQGDWRAVMLVLRSRNTVIVERIAHRREVYR